ncbi:MULTISPECIES: hypothetical protein [Actinosynnema]|uniref:hypothetical protein n=1 Tax=Actinosynnema TaxID=40566 RepID=UPI0020A324C9|nr:hypothetical protein [Actinosynnema pretiosum]MCP2093250.1 hypothetical protein [Actinosynnema pretiosum]
MINRPDERQDHRLTTDDFARPQGRTDVREDLVDERGKHHDPVLEHGHDSPEREDDLAYAEEAAYNEERDREDDLVPAQSTREPVTEPVASADLDADKTHDPAKAHGTTGTTTPVTDAPGAEAMATTEIPVQAEVEPAHHSGFDAESPLFGQDEAGGFREEWRSLQGDFVDNPREAVHRADELVAQVIQSLATTFSEHKRTLEGRWQEGSEAETEELRLALKSYRSFFDKLLSV